MLLRNIQNPGRCHNSAFLIVSWSLGEMTYYYLFINLIVLPLWHILWDTKKRYISSNSIELLVGTDYGIKLYYK